MLDKVRTAGGRMGRQVQIADGAKLGTFYFAYISSIPCCLCTSIPLGGSFDTEYLAVLHCNIASVP